MKRLSQRFIILLYVGCAGLQVSCANRYREVNTGRDASQVSSMFSEALGVTTDTQFSAPALELYNSPTSVVYFAESSPENRAMGTIDMVAPMNFGFLDLSDGTRLLSSPHAFVAGQLVSSFRSYFIVEKISNGFRGGLLFDHTPVGGQRSVRIYLADGVNLNGAVADDLFEMNLSNQTSQLHVESTDVDAEGELMDILSVDVFSQMSGGLRYEGRINSMKGF